MVNSIIYATYSPSQFPSLINTTFGDELVKLMAQRPVELREIQAQSSFSGIELITRLGQFISVGLLRKNKNKFEMTIPILTADEQKEYNLKMTPYVEDLVDEIINYTKTSLYQERLKELVLRIDYDLDRLNYLILCCFGATWGGKYLFEQLSNSERHSALIITDSDRLGLLGSMTLSTTRYTFTSFGQLNTVNRHPLGNLFNVSTIINYLSPMLSPNITEHYSELMGLFCCRLLDKCGQVLLNLKKGSGVENDDEQKIILNLLEEVGYVEDGKRVTIPIFTEELNPILIELIRGFQHVCANWYTQSAHKEFEIKKFDSTKGINYSIYWILNVGLIREILIEKDVIQSPEDQQCISLCFTYPAEIARSLCKKTTWNAML